MAPNLLVVAGPGTPELSVLKDLPAGVNVVATGQTLEDFAALTPEQWASVDVMLNCGVGKNAGKKEHIQVSRRLTSSSTTSSSSRAAAIQPHTCSTTRLSPDSLSVQSLSRRLVHPSLRCTASPGGLAVCKLFSPRQLPKGRAKRC
jgi:hypothetical protein